MSKSVVKDPKEQAEELIADFIQMMPTGIDKIGYEFKTQYECAKIQAQYVCHHVKWSYQIDSYKYLYWQEVQNIIKNL